MGRSSSDVHKACQPRRVMGNGSQIFPSAKALGIWKGLARGSRAQTFWHQQDISGILSEKCQLVPGRFPICRSLEVPGEALGQPNVSVRCLFSDPCQPQQLPFSDAPCVAGPLLQALPDLIWWPSIHTQDRDYPPMLAGKKTTLKSVCDRVTMLPV